MNGSVLVRWLAACGGAEDRRGGGGDGGGCGGAWKPQGEAAERRFLPDVLLKFLTPPLSLHKLPDPPTPSLRNLSLAGKVKITVAKKTCLGTFCQC